MLAVVRFTIAVLLYLIILLVVLFAIVVAIQIRRISAQSIPGIPWVGLKGRRVFPKLRACLGELGAGRTMVEEGWEKYGKHGKPFMVPGLHWNNVVLPPSLVGWMARQPDAILSGKKPLSEMLGAEYLAHGPNVESVLNFTVVRRDLTRQTVKLNREILDEVRFAVDDTFGFGADDWTELGVKSAVDNVSFSATNRIFVGLPLCRNKQYKEVVTQWTTFFGIGTLFCRYLVPGFARSVVMRIIAIPANLMLWRASSYVTPGIKKRLAILEAEKALVGDKSSVEQKPNDMMQWIIDHNAQKADPAELKPANIAGRMILLNLFAFGTTSMMATMVLFDILSYKAAPELLKELREEADCVVPMLEEDATAVRSMAKLDSVIRETLRFNPLGAQGMVREVVTPGGVLTPDGLHLPVGTHVSNIASSMQRDKDCWGESADEYDPLRFYKEATEESLKGRQAAAVQLSEEYLSFGLGKHACPGRFFAVHVMKVMLGYLLAHYELEPFAERPAFTVFAEALIPKDETKIKVRRRKAGS